MILPSEKKQDVLDTTTDGEAEVLASSSPSYLGDSSQYQSESTYSSRALAPPPTFPTPFENTPPPSYSNDFANPATSSTPSYYAPASPATVAAMSAPRDSGMPPASFSRVPSGNFAYSSPQPMFLVATGKTLDKGFPCASPPSNSNPHPFVLHDVTEGDWISFLEEIRTSATLTEKQIGRSHLPIVSIVPIVNCLAAYGVQKIMKYRNAAKVIDCIDKWNRHFFEQRKLKVVLMKGQVNTSGQGEDTATSTSKYPKSEYQNGENPPSSSTGISQALAGKNDDIYRLFVVPLS
ncbi:hypothetical protein BYT27DRAFT_7174775 [Phlegmacium glaucopus]|nr:hypothetical protein BYT27DRAFT_7174775 [Phlegmacium glaucopus]